MGTALEHKLRCTSITCLQAHDASIEFVTTCPSPYQCYVILVQILGSFLLLPWCLSPSSLAGTSSEQAAFGLLGYSGRSWWLYDYKLQGWLDTNGTISTRWNGPGGSTPSRYQKRLFVQTKVREMGFQNVSRVLKLAVSYIFTSWPSISTHDHLFGQTDNLFLEPLLHNWNGVPMTTQLLVARTTSNKWHTTSDGHNGRCRDGHLELIRLVTELKVSFLLFLLLYFYWLFCSSLGILLMITVLL